MTGAARSARRQRGRCAIVTGAADGIGWAIAERLAEEGARVLAVDIAGDALAAVYAGRQDVVTLAVDVAAPDAAEAIVAAARTALGGVEILVNNAGIRGRRQAIDATSDADWRRVMDVNLDAAFRLSRAASPLLTAMRGGRIINIGSIQGMFAAPTLGAFVVSKHALNGLTRAFALDLGRRGATVNCVMPGFVDTGLTRTMKQDAPEIWDRLMGKIAIGRQGRPADIAAMVAFLAAPEADFVTGACIPVDGGMSCWN